MKLIMTCFAYVYYVYLGLFSLYKQAQLLYKGYSKESIFSVHIIISHCVMIHL